MNKSSPAQKPLFLNDNATRKLEKREPWIFAVDAFSRQIKELFFIDNPQYASESKTDVYTSDIFKKYATKKKNAYAYVFYPWNNHLVKTVRAEDYFRLKTNRNQDLITATEQKKLARFRVAVLGMSVGSNIAFVLTQAGISREIILADFDELDTTNLNRIFGGAHQIGLNKTFLAARRIYEDNPFAKVTLLPKGVNEKNLESLLKQKKVDCLVDEIDNIPVKITIRQLAMKYKVPVLMITDNGDGIVLHIERYDLGYKKIFHNNLRYWQKKLQVFEKEKGGEKKIAGGIIMDDIVGGAHLVDPNMLASVKKVLNRKLVSWSQLGSAAMLGGVYITYALKQIILGKDKRKEVRAHINPHF
ncbi:MAG: hypothetical protein COU35_00790 [Candidatus Magasanikbacteria bacterium CG10_big_fil_rev_8_21_14_0_10_47_10]|uniref:THIF-type NAD/FAD binding fold domain-containing protein n=1 Tax=Candidatus Magasanikbacteria bacterium CG10_big_fil_rev_8_21_14_0_10_47_10 TaxID=1974652 RepID=A0A2H0TT86_9BACT|nr:MAG: hypothetical protein COU35_00790 [Candidatus Magasanikbacteria bacterium CG10_big_fil_rev_8_21_14_0_10_47_10]